jgi:hypothetical protein
MKEHGAQWSVLNKLSYWQPIEYCSIKMMHLLILGNLKDYSLRFLSLAFVGNKLSKMQEKDCEWQNNQSYTETPYTNTFGPKPKGFLKKGKGKRRRREDEMERTDNNQPIKHTRQQNTNVPSGSRVKQTAPVPSTSGCRSNAQGSSSDHSSSHSYQLQVRKQILYSLSQQESETGGSGLGKVIKPWRAQKSNGTNLTTKALKTPMSLRSLLRIWMLSSKQSCTQLYLCGLTVSHGAWDWQAKDC